MQDRTDLEVKGLVQGPTHGSKEVSGFEHHT